MITGTIQSVVPTAEVGYQSSMGYIYTFDMVVKANDGQVVSGQIGSKSQQYPLAVGAEINVEVKNTQHGTRLKKVNPKYANAPQGQPPQRTYQPVDDSDKIARITRGNALNAVMSAATIGSDEIGPMLKTAVAFIETGNWTYPMRQPAQQPAPQPALQPETQQVLDNAGLEQVDDIPF